MPLRNISYHALNDLQFTNNLQLIGPCTVYFWYISYRLYCTENIIPTKFLSVFSLSNRFKSPILFRQSDSELPSNYRATLRHSILIYFYYLFIGSIYNFSQNIGFRRDDRISKISLLDIRKPMPRKIKQGSTSCQWQC